NNQLHRLLPVAVHRYHRTARVEFPAKTIEPPHQAAPVADAFQVDALRQAEEVAAGHRTGIDANVCVDGQPCRLVGSEGIALLAEIAAEGEVRRGGLECD